MGKFNINPPSFGAAVAKEATNLPGAKLNRAGGLAYDIADASTKLLTMIGGQFFNEPTYYAVDKAGTDGLTEMAREVVETAKAVSNSEIRNDILSIAHYVRKEKGIRTTPAVLFAVAAGERANPERMVEYAPKILRRPDEVLQAFAAFYALYGTFRTENGRVLRRAVMPNSYKKALAAALAQFDEYQLSKWDSNSWPRIKDVLLTVYRRNNYPLNADLAKFFITGEVVNPAATPILAAKKELNALPGWTPEVPSLLKKAHFTWEETLSKFGNKKEVWEALIDGGRATLPVMAAVRNLRNMEQAGISEEHWTKVSNLVMSVNDNKMMPFRFIAARKNTTNRNAISIADFLLDKAVQNVQDLPGVTLILADNSGSMNTPLSGKSEMTKKEVANTIAAIFAKKFGTRAVVAAFGTNLIPVSPSLADSTYRIFGEVESAGHRAGGSTQAAAAIDYYTSRGVKVDRIVLLSDMQCYDSRHASGYYGVGNVQAAFSTYLQKVNPSAKLYSVDIGGYGDAIAQGSNVWLSTGYNESIITEMLAFEGLLEVETSDGVVVPATTMEFVRANF